MSSPSRYLSGLYAEVLSVEGCEDPPPPYSDSTGFEDVQQHVQLLRRPYQSPDAPAPSPATPDGRPISGLSSLGVFGCTVALHTSMYVLKSLETNAWGTRAIEYAVGTGCVAATASVLQLVKTRRLADALPEWTHARGLSESLGAEGDLDRRFLTALTVGLSTAIPGIGYCIRSLAAESPEDHAEFLKQAFSGAVPTLVVMVAIQRMRPRSSLIASEI